MMTGLLIYYMVMQELLDVTRTPRIMISVSRSCHHITISHIVII